MRKLEAVERLAGEREVGVGECFGATEADDRVKRATQRLLGAETVCRRHQVPVRVQQRHQFCTGKQTPSWVVPRGHAPQSAIWPPLYTLPPNKISV